MDDFEKELEFLAEALERIASKELDEETVEFLRKGLCLDCGKKEHTHGAFCADCQRERLIRVLDSTS